MLKWWSPMSIGSWGITFFGAFALLSSLAALEEGRWFTWAPAWLTAVPQIQPERPTEAPLLAGATLVVPLRTARAWVSRLLKHARKERGPTYATLAALDVRGLDAFEFLKAGISQDEARLADLAKTADADSGTLGAIAQLAALPLLQACGHQLAAEVPSAWSWGYCPVCGAWPTLAELHGLERSRNLRCGRCGGQWAVPWLRCPFCGESDHQRLGALVPENGYETRKVDTCMVCKGYIKTVTALQSSPAHALILEDLASIDLDLIALERGYARPERPGYPLAVHLAEPPRSRRSFFGRPT